MIVLFRQLLPGLAEHGATCAALGIEAARHVRALGETARDAGAALARRLARRRCGIRLLPARRRQRGVVRRLGGLPELGFQLGDAGQQPLDLSQQLRVLLNQRREQPRRAVVVRRIGRLLRHAALESARPRLLNTSPLSHTVAAG